jgi:hypothetical protein
MKKHNKIFSCLLVCAIFSASTFSSVSAMKRAMFVFDEESATEEAMFLFDEELESSDDEDAAPAAESAASKAKTAPIAIKPIKRAPLEGDDAHLATLPRLREFLPETLIHIGGVLCAAASKAVRTPQSASSEEDGALKESSPRARAAELVLPLQTEETMREKEYEFLAKYREILASKGSHIDTVHKWKHDIFLYLKSLYAQLHKHPETISDRQILDFFLDIKQAIDHGPRPNLAHTDYKLRFDPVYGLSGAIICSPPGDPHHVLARL